MRQCNLLTTIKMQLDIRTSKEINFSPCGTNDKRILLGERDISLQCILAHSSERIEKYFPF
jgi:hypothetical protein